MIEVTNLNTELLARKSVSPVRETENGKLASFWATLDGAGVTEELVQALVADGRVFHARVGEATTPVTLDASWANTDPDLSMDIPSGVTVIPLRVAVIYEAFGTDAVVETMTLCSQTLAASSAGTLFTSVNYRLRHPRASVVKVYVGPTVTSGYTGTYFELYRDCQQTAGTQAAGEGGINYRVEWNYKNCPPCPLLEGSATMQTWGVGQASSGYIDWVWAEIPSLPTP
uniref:Uncharacterized protein n=1 Tax=viral metagenome TaxID=1070528 RepID=A0A6M3LQR6_9ZZZZ